MFKSIELKLYLFTALLIIAVILATGFFIKTQPVYGSISTLAALIFLVNLNKNYRKFNKNILFLLNALDNGDYTFHFSANTLSKRENELNHMLNRIKEILTKARKEVIENEKFLSIIVESVSTGIIILDDRNNIRKTNQAAIRLLGLPVFTHLKQLATIDKSLPRQIEEMNPDQNIQIKINNEKEEQQISLRLTHAKINKNAMKIITLNSIGNELEAKEMESWIRLIRVMTHEIMNSIAPITSLTETLLNTYKTEQKTHKNTREKTVEALETIGSTAKGLITFVESYRKFTGIPQPKPTNIPLIPLLEQIIQLETPRLKEKNIAVEIFHDNRQFNLYADKIQITQVLINLVKNAEEAIEHEKNGKIKFKIFEKENKITIEIWNNGETIPDNIAPNIFIPFFTTKEHGSGIGLSVSRYIMRLHGGNLKHHTSNGYTVFSMVF